MRLGDEEFRIVTGGAHGMADRKLFADRLPADGSATLVDVTTAWTTIGLWGPRARDILASVTVGRRLARGLPVRHVPDDRGRLAARARVAHLVRRRPRLGALRPDRAGRLGCGTRSGRPARRTALTACGIGVYGTTGRLEKCYRAFARRARDASTTSSRPGWQRPKVKEQDFVGKEAHLRHREEEPAAILCTLTIDDHASGNGVRRFPLGREPITLRDGTPLTDAKGRRSYVTSAGAGPSLGKYILMSYLPPERAVEGSTDLAVEYMNERYPVTVDVVGARPIFDPENTRIRS